MRLVRQQRLDHSPLKIRQIKTSHSNLHDPKVKSCHGQFGNLEASVRSPAGRSMGSMCSGDLIEAGLNEGAAGFARDYGDCIFARWRMPSLGVAVNGT